MTAKINDRCLGAGHPDLATMHRSVIAAVNRNDITWLLWALGIPQEVPRAQLASTVQQLLNAGRERASEVLLHSPIETLRSKLSSREAVASLLFDFGPAIIMMMASMEARATVSPMGDC